MAVLFTAAFGFLLASFAAQNPDLWAHLAAGRDLAHGRLTAAIDLWARDALTMSGWLYNLAAYAVYSVAGGPGLVFIKALLAAGVGLVLLRVSRIRPGWLIPAVCTGLALLGMNPGMRLQPVTVSYLLLAMTLSLLWRGEATAGGPVRPPWPLLVVFLAWANTDRWFVLGLGMAALTWLGQALDRPAGRLRAAAARTGTLALLAGVCVLNPAHVWAFTFAWGPTGGPAAGAGPSLRHLLSADALERSPAELAYVPLLGLGLLSFVLALPRWQWGRFLPWVGFAALSAPQVRFAPFFAVVAGPVLAWNLQDFFARRAAAPTAPSPVARRLRLAGGLLAGVLGLVFLACAWTGWLRGPPFGPRRWAIDTPPALARGGEAVARWQAAGRFGTDGRGLHLSPATAFAFAWFCPDEVAGHDPGLVAAALGDPSEGPARLRAARVNHLIVYDSDRAKLSAALRRLFADPDQFPLLLWQGDLAVFGWRDPDSGTAADPFRDARPDFDFLALHPGPGEKAPTDGVAAGPEPRRWWDAFWRPAPPRSIDAAEAAFHLLHADAARRTAPARHQAAWDQTQVTGLVGAATLGGAPSGLLDATIRLTFLRMPGASVATVPLAFVWAGDDAPMAVLYLAVRAARRALAVNPQDPVALVALGEAYWQLLTDTRERAWIGRFPELAQLRRVQVAAALTQAIGLNPDLAQAHARLGDLYAEMGCMDLALKHQRAYLAAVRKAGPPGGTEPAGFHQQTAALEGQLGQLADAIAERERVFLRDAAGVRVLDRAVLARDQGLVGRALDVLLQSDISAFGASGMALELELLLRTGRVKEVRDWTDPDHQSALGPRYHWLRAQALAASGEYAAAQDECRLLGAGDLTAPGGPRAVLAVVVGQAALDEQPGAGGLGWLIGRALPRADYDRRVTGLTREIQRAADASVLRGLIALEAGDVGEAEVAFRLALDTWTDEAAARSGRGLDFTGRPVAQGCLKWIDAGGRGK